MVRREMQQIAQQHGDLGLGQSTRSNLPSLRGVQEKIHQNTCPKIRPARKEDVAGFRKIASDIWGEEASVTAEVGVFSREMSGKQHDKRQINVVAERGGELFGYAALRPISEELFHFHMQMLGRSAPSGTICYLTIGVARMYRRQGIGESLLRDIIEKARRAGHEAIFLDVHKFNSVANLLYLKCGFDYSCDGPEADGTIRMFLDLKKPDPQQA